MKLNLQRSPIYIYMPFNDYDGFKIMPIFEDMDETDLKYNINCKKKSVKFLVDLENAELNLKKLKTSFYNDFFINDK